MAVTKTNYGPHWTYVGTLAEVVGALRDDGIKRGQVLGFEYDGADWNAILTR